MSSVNWNEYNDSSSISSMSSDLEDVLGKQGEKDMETPSLNKIVSSPNPQPKNNTQRQNKIDENIEKIKNHKGEKVFLYVPQNQRFKDKNIIEILSKEQDIEKVTPSNKGWQVLILTQRAEKYLQKGLFTNGLQIKFLYSIKNENKNKPREYTSPGFKVNKRAKQFSSPNSRDQIKSPKFKQKYSENEKKYQRKDTGKNEPQKKKVKYIAKTIQQKVQENHIDSPELPNQKQKQKPQAILKVDNKQVREDEKKIEVPQDNVKDDQNSSNTSEQLKKMKKQILKKKGKKKNKGKGGYQDTNNPFASFAGND